MTQPYRITIIHEGIDTRRRLDGLRLDLDRLAEVVLRGEHARAEATAHDPINAAALDAYRYRVRGLRDTFVPEPYAWVPDRHDGIELLRSPCGRRAIMTRAGDEGVGDRRAHPQPQRTLGEATARTVAANGTNLLDANWMNAPEPIVMMAAEFETWMLLVYRRGDTVRAELSHPSGTTDSGQVLGWIERILLPDIELGDDPMKKRDDEGGQAAEIPDVPVSRKR